MLGFGANERQSVPIALENVLVEESKGTVADTHGGGGKAIDIFSVQEVGLEFRFGDQSRRFAVELSEQAYLTNIGLLGTLTLPLSWRAVIICWRSGVMRCLPS